MPSATILKLNLTETEVVESGELASSSRGDAPEENRPTSKLRSDGRRGGRVLYPVADLDQWLAQRPRGGER